MPTIADRQPKFQQTEPAPRPVDWAGLGPLLERLAGEGVRSIADWKRLGPRRFELWGITRKTVQAIDRIARSTP